MSKPRVQTVKSERPGSDRTLLLIGVMDVFAICYHTLHYHIDLLHSPLFSSRRRPDSVFVIEYSLLLCYMFTKL